MMPGIIHQLVCRKRKRSVVIFILLFITFFFLVSLSSHVADPPGVCSTPNNNLLYIKMIKCASETLASVFRRYAYTRNLSIVLPVQDRIYLGWPYAMDDESYRPSKTGGFNMLVDHAVYDEGFMSDLMPEGTAFVTSIREPYSQFKSMFNYYKLALNSNMSDTVPDPVTEYLTHLDKYERLYKSHNMAAKRYCIPDGYSMSKNLMAFNLGFPAGKPDGTLDGSDNDESIQYFLASIQSKFKLVMIVEHFDESMLLLKRLMCWRIKDILYHTRNVGQYATIRPSTTKDDHVDKRNIKIYKKWSSVDYRLYDHFLKIFWQKVKDEGSGFNSELKYYKKINRVANKYCQDLESKTLDVNHKITVAKSSYTEAFVLDAAFCKVFNSSLNDEVRTQYKNIPVHVEPVNPQKLFC